MPDFNNGLQTPPPPEGLATQNFDVRTQQIFAEILLTISGKVSEHFLKSAVNPSESPTQVQLNYIEESGPKLDTR